MTRKKVRERKGAEKGGNLSEKRNSLFSSGKIFREALLRRIQRPSCIVVVCFGLPTTRAFEQAAEKTQASFLSNTMANTDDAWKCFFFLSEKWETRNVDRHLDDTFSHPKLKWMNAFIIADERENWIETESEPVHAACSRHQSTSSCENRNQHVWGLSSGTGRFSKQNLMHIVECATCAVQFFITFKLLSTTISTMIAVFEKFSARFSSVSTSRWNFVQWIWFSFTIHLAHWDWMKLLENVSSFQEITKKCWKFATSLATSLSKCWAMEASIWNIGSNQWTESKEDFITKSELKKCCFKCHCVHFLFGHRLLVVDEIWYNARWRAGTNRSERKNLKSLRFSFQFSAPFKLSNVVRRKGHDPIS